MIGIYVLYIIISPALKFINGSELKIDYSKYEKYFNTSETSTTIETPSINDTYKIQLEKQMKSDIENMGYGVSKINTELNIEEGTIGKVTLSVYKDQKTKKDSINISVNKIDIGGKYEDESLSEEETEQIKQKITKDYGAQYENISVNSK